MMRRHQSGQALLALVGVLACVVIGALLLGAVARGLGLRQHEQGVADLAALAGLGRCTTPTAGSSSRP